jgi:hypothetical protein
VRFTARLTALAGPNSPSCEPSRFGELVKIKIFLFYAGEPDEFWSILKISGYNVEFALPRVDRKLKKSNSHLSSFHLICFCIVSNEKVVDIAT